MPHNGTLLPVDSFIGHTKIVGVNNESPFFELCREVLLKEQSSLEGSIQGLLEDDVDEVLSIFLCDVFST
jgi:hypothetical protein